MKLFRQVLLSLIILFALAYLYFYLYQMKLDNQTLRAQVNQLQTSQTALVNQQLHFEANQESSASLAWMHAKAFVLDADAVLMIRQNPEQTTALLELAQQQIASINGDKFILLNTALGEDLLMLSTLPAVNVTAITQTINTIESQIDQISFVVPVQNNTSTAAPAPVIKSEWKKTWHEIKTELKSLFVVERTDTSFEGLVSVQDHALMQTYLKSLLQQASLAAMQKNNVIYQASLQQANLFLNTYYLPHTPLIDAIITQINSLAAIDVAPTLPTQLKSMAIIEAAQ